MAIILTAYTNSLEVTQGEHVIAGGIHANDVEFRFKEDDTTWAGMALIGCFESDLGQWCQLLDENHCCELPWEVIAKGSEGSQLKIGLYGADENDASLIIRNTVWATAPFRILPGPDATPSKEPTLSLYQQMLIAASKVADSAAEVLMAADEVAAQKVYFDYIGEEVAKNTQATRANAALAQGSANKAAESEAEADASATAAKVSETNAKTSETNASLSETNAKDSETNAKDSETNAALSETNAKDSETNAKTSETNAKVSEENAKSSELAAQAAKEAAEEAAETAADDAVAEVDTQMAQYVADAQAAKTAAEKARDEASEIAGGDFATKAELAEVADTIPTKVSELDNDAGYISSVPVTSVNGKTGAVSLSANDVGAAAESHTHDYAKTEDIPTKVSELDNDSGYISSYTETDPTVPAWAKKDVKPSYTPSEIGITAEAWTFTLEDGSTVTKTVCLC